MANRGVTIAAGGHLGYAPMGTLYTNAVPNDPHIYGPVLNQVNHLPDHRSDSDDRYSSRSYIPTQSRIYAANMSERINYNLDVNIKQYTGHNDYLDPNRIRTTF